MSAHPREDSSQLRRVPFDVTDWEDRFDYPDGTLTGRGPWVTQTYVPFALIVTNHRAATTTNVDAGNLADDVTGAIDPAKPWSLSVDFMVDPGVFFSSFIQFWMADDDVGFYTGCDIEAGTSAGPPNTGNLYTEQSGGQGPPMSVAMLANTLYTVEIRYAGVAGGGTFQLYYNGVAVGAPRAADVTGVTEIYPYLISIGATSDIGIKIHRIAFHGIR